MRVRWHRLKFHSCGRPLRGKACLASATASGRGGRLLSHAESRASHLSMDDATSLRMSLHSIRRWLALQNERPAEAEHFYHRSGRLWAGPVGAPARTRAAIAATLGHAPEAACETLDAAAANRRFGPAVRLREGEEEALYMETGFVMLVEPALAALRGAAERAAYVAPEPELSSVGVPVCASPVSVGKGPTSSWNDLRAAPSGTRSRRSTTRSPPAGGWNCSPDEKPRSTSPPAGARFAYTD